MLVQIIGWLLHHANAAPPPYQREAFYQLKDRLLHRYGRRTGRDVQHIVKPCWNGPCWRCGHTGIYHQFWVLLERWTLGGWTFHRPIQRFLRSPSEDTGQDLPVTIEGTIRHDNPGPLATECALWLALRFDRALFRRLFFGSLVLRWTGWPLACLQQLFHRVRLAWTRYGPRRCHGCGHVFLPGHRPRDPHRCQPCESVYRLRVAELAEEIPF